MSEEKRYATEEEFNAEVERIYAEKLAELEEETVEAIAQIYAEAEKEREARASEWQAQIDELKAEGSGLKAEREAYRQRKIDSRFVDALQAQGVTEERAQDLLEYAKVIHARKFDFDTLKDDTYIKKAAFQAIMALGKKGEPVTKYLY